MDLGLFRPRETAGLRATMSLQAFLSGLIWLCVGPLLLLGAYLAIDRVRKVQDERNLDSTNLARTLATAVDQDLNARIAALKMLAASPMVDDAARWKDLYQEAQAFRESFGSHVILADLQMHMLFNTRVPLGEPLPMLPRPQGRAAAPLAAETGRPAVGDTFQGPIAQEPLVAIAVPALRQGKTSFLLLTVFEARRFQTILDQMTLPPGWSLALLDGQGEAIARRTPEGLDPGADVDAGGRFIVKSAVSAWSVAVEIPRDIHRTPLLESAAALALAVLGATLTGVVGGTLASRRLGRSVASLAQAPAPGAAALRITEIASVRRLLDEAAERRETAEATLLESEHRFRRLFYEAPLPQALITKAGMLAGLNARFEQVFGYSLEDVPTLAEWWQKAYPDPAYRATVVDAWNAAARRAAATSMMDIEPVERHITCKSGAVRIMVVSGIGIGNDLLSTFFDVTERKQAEEALRRSAELYQHTLDNMLEGCQIIGFDWRYRYVNAAGGRQNHQPPESLVGRTMMEVYPGIDATDIFATLRRCMEQRVAQQAQTEFVFPDGSRAWFDVNVQPAPEGIVIFSVDTTERRRVTEVRQRLAAIVESTDDAIISSTIGGVITSWNHGAERTFGYASDEAIGRPVREIIRPGEGEPVRAHERRVFHSRRSGDRASAEEVVRLHRDGHPITLSIVSSVIRDASGAVSTLAAIMRDITVAKRRDAELQRLLADQAARERLMRDLTARLRTSREEECTRISREVHDGLGQLLTCLKMDVRWMSRRLAAGGVAADLLAKLAETEALVDQTVESVQRIAIELRPSVLDALGLPAAIRDEARRFEARTGVVTIVETAATALPDPAVATALFRILQELLTNVARHAQASSLSITLADDVDAWVLRVHDDGVGIAAEMADRATSLGLLGMTERAEAIGGAVCVERHPGGGTIATVRVPHPTVARIEDAAARADR